MSKQGIRGEKFGEGDSCRGNMIISSEKGKVMGKGNMCRKNKVDIHLFGEKKLRDEDVGRKNEMFI